MIIPQQDVSPDVPDNLIENFVLHESTDYGEHERSLEQKVADVKRQLQSGETVLAWSELHEMVSTMLRRQIHEQSAAADRLYYDYNHFMELLYLPNIR